MKRFSTMMSLTAVAGLAATALAQHGEAAAEHAAEGHELTKAGVMPTLQEGIVPMLVAIGVFAVVFVLLRALVWPKILGGLQDRENKIRTEIEAAEEARRQAKDALEQYQKSLADARAEAQKMIDTTKAQQASLAAELKAKADAELGAMRERALKDIESAKRAAVSEIYAQTTRLAMDAAGQILRRSVTTDDNRRLVEESMQQLQSARN